MSRRPLVILAAVVAVVALVLIGAGAVLLATGSGPAGDQTTDPLRAVAASEGFEAAQSLPDLSGAWESVIDYPNRRLEVVNDRVATDDGDVFLLESRLTLRTTQGGILYEAHGTARELWGDNMACTWWSAMEVDHVMPTSSEQVRASLLENLEIERLNQDACLWLTNLDADRLAYRDGDGREFEETRRP